MYLTLQTLVQGYQVSPAELEGHILAHPFVQDVGVVGHADERSGEVPVAFVVLNALGLERSRIDSGLVKESIC